MRATSPLTASRGSKEAVRLPPLSMKVPPPLRSRDGKPPFRPAFTRTRMRPKGTEG